LAEVAVEAPTDRRDRRKVVAHCGEKSTALRPVVARKKLHRGCERIGCGCSCWGGTSNGLETVKSATLDVRISGSWQNGRSWATAYAVSAKPGCSSITFVNVETQQKVSRLRSPERRIGGYLWSATELRRRPSARRRARDQDPTGWRPARTSRTHPGSSENKPRATSNYKSGFRCPRVRLAC